MDYAARSAALASMRAALASTQHQRTEVIRQFKAEALERSRTHVPEWQRSGVFPCSSRWNGAFARRMDQALVAIHFERGRELDALERKIDRQVAAIAAFRRKHGINEPEGVAA